MTDGQRIALGFAQLAVRANLTLLWDYDAMLGQIVATTTEPMIGQMRLTWWHDAVVGLDEGKVSGEPMLARLYDLTRTGDVNGKMLASLIEGWEGLLEPLPLPHSVLSNYANARGRQLFELSLRVLGSSSDPDAGAAWALVDFASRCTDVCSQQTALTLARNLFAGSKINGPRPLSIIARLARAKAERPDAQFMLPMKRRELLWAILR